MKIALDIDGVLADFHKGVYEYFGKKPENPTDWNDPYVVEAYKKVKHDSVFWSGLGIVTKPEKIDFDVYCYITHREINPDVTYNWLIENGFPDSPVYNAVGCKSYLVKMLGVGLLVDDKYETFLNFRVRDINCLLFHQSHNVHEKDFGKRIKCLSEVRRFL